MPRLRGSVVGSVRALVLVGRFAGEVALKAGDLQRT